ncbi:hypothetical protein CEUSTIGMA_g5082.t1 [Chlamydomonas eustigma]|uniref:AAA+ ATPase domain-containing protein n=1 Tax=Chlamydomonas eustigma TaxID=1157962 RepID=A0A250X3Z2_9CHLO|nr:hypothetical protein CEUSTIGMA_g5082.t1 [Chlamydomonas eustigma]|eukprot:GAX77639.1 hypothetical protein CEUSTIGMA_g5082.t1 [Chlamydomonas eustigma]
MWVGLSPGSLALGQVQGANTRANLQTYHYKNIDAVFSVSLRLGLSSHDKTHLGLFAARRGRETRGFSGKDELQIPPSITVDKSLPQSIEPISSEGQVRGDDNTPSIVPPSPSMPDRSADSQNSCESSTPPSTPSSSNVSPPEEPKPGTISWLQKQAWLAPVFAALAWLLAKLQSLPYWVRMQQLRKLKEQADEDPKDADRHAAYLYELNRGGSHAEAMQHVEAKEHASNAAVVVEYLRALAASGRLSEYAAASAASSSTTSAGGATAGSRTMSHIPDDHRSLTQLLRDLQLQVEGEQPDDSPGTSMRRPLHVVLSGGGVVGAPAAMQKPLGPIQVLWSLLRTALLLIAIAFAWLVGSQAVRRAQSLPAATGSSSLTSAVTSSSQNATSGTTGNSSGNGGPSTEPKEYKKEELPEKSVKTFADVRGCDEAKEELKEVVEFLKNPGKFTRLGAKLPKGVLLTGPPGTGKTLLARAVAGEAEVPFFYRAGSEFEELYVGVGARRMRALFQAAKKKAPCIVFIDEIDAIGGNRKHWENNTRKTLNQLLVEMDGFESNDGVIVVAATNLAETLDPALKRPGRFDRQVAVPLPDIKGRADILEYYLLDKPVSSDVDAELLARQTQGFSGADISNLINEAALLAAKEDKDSISPAMLDYAFDKIRMGVERKSVRRTLEGLKRTAFHESGHAIVAVHTVGASPIHKATIVPRGHALGMVTQVGRDDEFSINRQQMLARLRVCMGGTVAEELVFGQDQVSSGATDDLRQATEMARYMVTQCGFNGVVGPLYVSDDKYLSEDMRRQIDVEVRQLLVEAREDVKTLLTERMKELHSLATALIDRETLTKVEIEAVLRGETLIAPPGASPGALGTAKVNGQGEVRGEEEGLEGEGATAPESAMAAEEEQA